MTEKEITIPEIEIAPNWYVSDITSLEEAEDAADYIVEQINNIESQLIEYQTRQMKLANKDWYVRAMIALRYKKYAKRRIIAKLDFYESERRSDTHLAQQIRLEELALERKKLKQAQKHDALNDLQLARKAKLELAKIQQEINFSKPKRVLDFLRDHVSYEVYDQLMKQFEEYHKEQMNDE